jgi:hypothetical protein
MTSYRFELLDAEGKVAKRRHIECDDVDAALGKAGEILDQTVGAIGIEVWDGTYLIQSLEKSGA